MGRPAGERRGDRPPASPSDAHASVAGEYSTWSRLQARIAVEPAYLVVVAGTASRPSARGPARPLPAAFI